MKKTKKVLALVLALGMVSAIGLTACGGDKGGDSSSVDAGNSKGEQVTLQEWTTAVTNTFEADNVTMNTFLEYVDEADGFIGTENGVIKLADGVMHDSCSCSETYNGVTLNYTEETYILKEDGTYYEWYKDSVDTLEWEISEYRNSEYSPTVQGVVFSEEWTAEEIIALYEDLEFDATTGEYSLFVEDEYDPFMMKVKIANDKFYTLTVRMSSEYENDSADGDAEDVWHNEMKYVFVNYGTTSVKLPNEEEEEGGKDESSEDGKTSSSVWQPTAMTEEEWNAAFANTFAAENINISGSSSITARGLTDTATVTSSFADGKAYAEIVYAMGGTERCYLGNVFDESYGYEVPYKWIWDSDTSSWDCAYSDMGVVTAEDAFSLADLGLQGWFSKMNNYSAATYDAEKDCYLVTLEDFNNASLEIAFADGKLASLKVSAVDNVDFVGEMIESSMYTITYGKATVGNLPAVTI